MNTSQNRNNTIPRKSGNKRLKEARERRWTIAVTYWRHTNFPKTITPKVKVVQKQSTYAHPTLSRITAKSTEEVHQLTAPFAAEIIAKYTQEATGKKIFTHTTKNKFRAWRKQLNRLSAIDRASLQNELILKY